MIKDVLKTSWNYILIFWNMKIYLRLDQYNFFSCLEGDRTKQQKWLVLFCLKRVWPFVYIIFFWVLEWKWESGIQYWLLLLFTLWLSIFNLGILKVACQKKPREDGLGGDGGTADNIWGEVGWIPPYPTFIPPGPKKLFCRKVVPLREGSKKSKCIFFFKRGWGSTQKFTFQDIYCLEFCFQNGWFRHGWVPYLE